MYFYIFIAAGRLFDEIDVIYTLNEILKLQAVQKYFKIIKKIYYNNISSGFGTLFKRISDNLRILSTNQGCNTILKTVIRRMSEHSHNLSIPKRLRNF